MFNDSRFPLRRRQTARWYVHFYRGILVLVSIKAACKLLPHACGNVASLRRAERCMAALLLRRRGRGRSRPRGCIADMITLLRTDTSPFCTVTSQQALLAVHRVRQAFVSARTAQSNQLRGLLTEFGNVMPKGTAVLEKRMPQVLEDAANGLPAISRELFARLYAHFKELGGQVDELERQIKAWHRENAVSQRLEAIPGIGPLSATALAASIGDARVFKNGRQFAAWLGLVPRQCSSGGKERLLGISKRGDSYLRTLLIHGARSVLLRLKRRTDQGAVWLARLVARRSPNVAAVALANKNARVIWAMLAHGRDYQADYIATPATA